MSETNTKILKMMDEVKKQKAEIQKLQKPSWQTNCSFSYSGKQGEAINLHTVSDVRTLISIVAFLVTQEKGYVEAAKTLGVDNAPTFAWQGYSVAEWTTDVRTRIEKLQIASKEAKLKQLEERLDKIVTPELRAQLELEAIESELK